MSEIKFPSAVPAEWEIEWRVRHVTSEECELDFHTLSPDSRLLEDLGIDSLGVIELILALEEEFSITIPDEIAQTFFTRSPTTLRTLANLVRHCWGTGTPSRGNLRLGRPVRSPSEEVPFTQLGPGAVNYLRGPLYESLGLNREGYFEYRRRTDGMRCVLMPAGIALIGTDSPDQRTDQKPAHTVQLSEYLIDAEPVSHAAFARFLNSVGDIPHTIITEWCGVREDDKRLEQFALRRDRQGWIPVPGTERQPMILVSWFGANAYSLWANHCDWRLYRSDGAAPEQLEQSSKQFSDDFAVALSVSPVNWGLSHLPSEAQREHAASGEAAPRVRHEDSVANGYTARVAQHFAGAEYTADTIPSASVSERLGMSPFGLHHMAGNVWQWCRDWYEPDFYHQPAALLRDPQNVEPTGIRSERGGSWVGPPYLAVPWYRRGRPPEARGRCLGFRCTGILPDLEEMY